MALRTKKTAVFLALQVAIGTVFTITGANAIVTHDAKIKPLEGSTVKRDLDSPKFGHSGELTTGTYVMVEFDVEVAPSGIAGTAPKWGPCLKACGMAETVVATTSVTYAPASNSTDCATIYFQLDGQRHAVKDAVGTWTYKLDSGGIPYLHFVFTGLYIDPTTTADLAQTLTGWTIPKPVTYANTPTASLHGLASIFKSFSFDYGNTVEYFNNPGEESVGIMDRESTGSISLLAPVISTKDYFGIAKANTRGALSIVHGMGAGTIATFAAPAVQILKPSYGDDKGRATLDASLAFCYTGGDDEMSLVLT